MERLSVKQLRQELRERGLDTSGSRAQLLKRLRESYDGEEAIDGKVAASSTTGVSYRITLVKNNSRNKIALLLPASAASSGEELVSTLLSKACNKLRIRASRLFLFSTGEEVTAENAVAILSSHNATHGLTLVATKGERFNKQRQQQQEEDNEQKRRTTRNETSVVVSPSPSSSSSSPSSSLLQPQEQRQQNNQHSIAAALTELAEKEKGGKEVEAEKIEEQDEEEEEGIALQKGTRRRSVTPQLFEGMATEEDLAAVLSAMREGLVEKETGQALAAQLRKAISLSSPSSSSSSSSSSFSFSSLDKRAKEPVIVCTGENTSNSNSNNNSDTASDICSLLDEASCTGSAATASTDHKEEEEAEHRDEVQQRQITQQASQQRHHGQSSNASPSTSLSPPSPSRRKKGRWKDAVTSPPPSLPSSPALHGLTAHAAALLPPLLAPLPPQQQQQENTNVDASAAAAAALQQQLQEALAHIELLKQRNLELMRGQDQLNRKCKVLQAQNKALQRSDKKLKEDIVRLSTQVTKLRGAQEKFRDVQATLSQQETTIAKLTRERDRLREKTKAQAARILELEALNKSLAKTQEINASLQRQVDFLSARDLAVRSTAELNELMRHFSEGIARVSAALTSALDRERKALAERRNCKICFDREIEVLLLPCCHYVACEACSRECARCPVCRRPVAERRGVFTT